MDKAIAEEVRGKNEAQAALFQKLKAAGEKNIYYLSSQGMTEPEDYVDGVHFTDRGMVNYANLIEPLLEAIL